MISFRRYFAKFFNGGEGNFLWTITHFCTQKCRRRGQIHAFQELDSKVVIIPLTRFNLFELGLVDVNDTLVLFCVGGCILLFLDYSRNTISFLILNLSTTVWK